MKARFALATIVRDSRGARGQLAFFTACLAIGVAAVVGVAGLTGSIEDGIRAQSRNILTADLAVVSRRPLPEELGSLFESVPDHERTDVRDLATMASVPEDEARAPRATAAKSRLVELRVVDGRYPLYGELALEPARSLGDLLDAHSAVVAPELCEALGLEIGDRLDLGGATFRIAGRVLREPDRLGFSLTLGPRVFLTAEGYARTSLEGFGSRIRYRALFALPAHTQASELADLEDRLERELPGAEYLRIETHADAQPDLRRSIARVESHLGLVALLSLVLGGAGVAQIVRAWLVRRTPEIAVLRCLGARAREIAWLTLGSIALLALAGSVLGAIAGSALAWIAPTLVPGFFPAELVRPWQPAAIARGLALGIGAALFFSLLPLSAIWRVAPARVLRSEVEPLPPSRRARRLAVLALAAAIFASAWLQARSSLQAAYFTAGLAVLAALLFGAARLLVYASAHLPRERLHPTLRHGIAALARPGSGTVGAIVALGLGVMVVVAMALVERGLARELAGALPADAPSMFFVDVQPDQWPGVRTVLESEGASAIRTVPVVTARLAAIDGVRVEELAGDRGEHSGRGGRERWVLTREQRLTWLDELPEDNAIAEFDSELVEPTAKAPWVDPDRAEVSLELEYAREMGAEIGSLLRFDVQGIEVELAVTSLRTVDWKTFGINFFVVVEPGALEGAPYFQIAAARVAPDAETRVQDRLAAEFPNVTPLRVRGILEKLADLLRRLGLGIRVLGGFTIVTGLAILAGVVGSAAAHRGREVALLKTLGLTRRGVASLFAIEHALAGFVAGVLGAAAAIALSEAFLEHVLEIRARTPIAALPLAALGSALLAAVCGVAAGARSLAARPIDSLRG